MEKGFDKMLLEGAYDGVLLIVKTYIDMSTDIETKDEYGDTALNKACSQGHSDIVSYLIEKGANIENVGGADLTPIINAATAGHFQTVHILISNGAKISDSLLSIMNMKVNILEENAEIGMVVPEAAAAWRKFFEYLIEERKKQDNL